MRTIAYALLLTAAVLLSTAARAADPPNFSGTWKQNMEKSATKSIWLKSYVNKIEQTDTTLKVTTTTVGDRGERTYDRTYAIGKEEKSKDREGDEFATLVKLDGSTLVFETTEKERDAFLTTRESWTLSADGKTLTKVLKRSGPRGESQQQYVLEKQSGSAAP